MNRNTGMHHPITCVETGEVFKNARVVGKVLNTEYTNLYRCFDHENRTCKGYHWRLATRDEIIKSHVMPLVRCIETGDIYTSVKEAAISNNVCYDSMRKACHDSTIPCRGKHWELI